MADTEVILGETYHQLSQIVVLEYVKENFKVIKNIRHGIPIRAELENRKYVYFVSEHDYPRWCKGRTYTMNGKLYHSGYEVKEQTE